MSKNINCQITDYSGETKNFESIRGLIDFLESEQKQWTENSQMATDVHSIKGRFFNSAYDFSNLISTLVTIQKNEKTWDENTFNQQLNSFRSNLSSLRNTWLWSGHAYIKPYVECNKKYGGTAADSFIEFLITKQINNIGDFKYFMGIMFAYEFQNQNSDIVKRSKSEKNSMEKLRNQLSTNNTKLINEVENFKSDFSNWDTDTKKDWEDRLVKFSEDNDEIHRNRELKFDELVNDANKRIYDLEKLYKEKLKLEGPATYWKKSAKKYGVQGGLWIFALVCLFTVGIIYFGEFFNSWLKGQELKVQLNSLQGVVIFGSFLAIYAFLVRAISKLAFSSFHLMRDSEEREQLTYLYLSLIEGKQIDEKSRDIVLQSLFSRSETGLLANDSGPTMPNIGDILNRKS